MTLFLGFNTSQAQNLTFVERFDSDNPLINVDGITMAGLPGFADLDDDGDIDLLITAQDSSYNYPLIQEYYKNIGDAQNPNFAHQIGSANPLNFLNNGGRQDAAPEFVDIDDDGDFDLFIASYDSTSGGSGFSYFENTGDAQNPVFTERTGSDNPADSVASTYSVSLAFVDIDDDGDYDLFSASADTSSGSYYPLATFYRNTGDAQNPVFEESSADNPLAGEEFGYLPFFSFADLDGDGDYDAFITNSQYNASSEEYETFLLYYENTGDAQNPAFTLRTGSDNPFDGEIFGYGAMPEFVDIDGDGDLDLAVGAVDYQANIRYLENTTGQVSAVSPDLAAQGYALTSYPNPFSHSTTIEYDIPTPQQVEIILYDQTGKVVHSQNPVYQSPGTHTYNWAGTDANGNKLANGIYICQIKVGNSHMTHRILLQH